jgi:hypothetical protein
MTSASVWMANRSLKHLQFLPAAFLVLSAAVFGAAQEPSGIKQNVRPEASVPTATPAPPKKVENDSTRFSYEFTQPEFYVRHIRIEHDANGRGVIKFERLHDEVIYEEPVELSPAAAVRISGLWQALRFLDSEENYQSERQYAHLGTMRLKMERDSRQRTAEFNWTNNKDTFALANEYRRVADQAILIFDIAVARETQPLNAPKLMEEVELQLKRNGLSDPQQLVPLLKDISTDEHLPLIARNHAIRLIKKIEK